MKIKMWQILIIHISSLLVMANAVRSSIYAPFNVISLNDITLDERRQIAYLEQKLERAKRSGSSGGSGDILNVLKSAIGNGIKKKIGQLAMASAAASGTFSRSSSSGGGGYHTEYHHHHPPDHHYEDHHSHKSVDFWDLKKSILNTLLQAVKAIKGGVIAVKGQLVKGGGKLVSASGSLISSQGDSITHLGKQIATSAILVPWMGSSGKGHPHAGYEHVDTHYSAPSAPGEVYHHSPPSDHGDFHGDYHESYPHPHREGAAGLLILKKITGQRNGHEEHYPPSQHTDSSPGFGGILGKFLSASSSLDPHKPEPIEDSPAPNDHPDSYQAYLVPSNDHRDNEVVPPAHKYDPSANKIPQVTDNGGYGTPFEEAPVDLNHNFDDAAPAASFNSASSQANDINDLLAGNSAASPFTAQEDSRPSYEHFETDPLPTGVYLSPPSIDGPVAMDFAPQNDQEIKIFLNTLKANDTDLSPAISSPSPYLETPKMSYFMPTPNDFAPTKTSYDSSGFSTKLRQYANYKTAPSISAQNFNLVQSLSYEIGPDGPKRLT